MKELDLLERLHVFTKKTLEWCANESEISITQVTEAINQLLKNTARVSMISQESLKAIEGMQKAISIQMGQIKGDSLKNLISNLQVLANEHDEIQTIMQPIVHSLQFQDRLRQNMENMVKMLPVWFDYRRVCPSRLTQQDLQHFGELLIKATTMVSERDQIRTYIAGLDPEPALGNVLIF